MRNESLEGVAEAIYQGAEERGIAFYPSDLTLDHSPEAEWLGSWEEFLDIAQTVNVAIVYANIERFDSQAEIAKLLGARAGGDPDLESDDKTWVVERAQETLQPWSSREGQVGSITLVWFNGLVAHTLSLGTSWFEEAMTAIGEISNAISKLSIDQSQEQAQLYYQYGEQLAGHPRYPEATNDSKRAFMAAQLFPDLAQDRNAMRSILHNASMIYWWDVEPKENITKAERARELFAGGESPKNIQAILQMSESKVREALGDLLIKSKK